MARAKTKKKSDAGGSSALAGATNPLGVVTAYLTKKKGKEFTDIVVAMNAETITESLPHISTGSDVVNYLIGGEPNKQGVPPCPGFPRGRLTQIWGHESAGKTTLALEAVAACCAAGGTTVYIDWENDIVPDYAHALGVPITDASKFLLLQPDTLEDGIKFAMAYATAGVDLIVFDSVGAAVTRRIAERDALDVAEQSKVAELQSVWSQELPNIKGTIARSGTAIVGISQVRANMNTGPGAKTKPQGGNAWKFYAAVRLELRRVQNEKAREHNALTHKTDERVVGGIILCKAVKCKVSRSQGREEVFYIRWGEGIDNVRTMIEIASSHGIIKKGGAWYTWADCPGGPLKMQGSEKIRTHLMENPDHYAALRARVIPMLGAGASDQYEDEGTDDELASLDAAMAEAGIDL